MKVLMCQPEFYEIKYEINPWMHKDISAQYDLANQQWQKLKSTIEACGAHVELVPPVKGLPDFVFTANAGLVYHDKVLLSEFKYSERQPERLHYGDWFQSAGFELLDELGACFEGAGDALFANNTLFAGYGFRTDAKIYETVAKLGDFNIVLCELLIQ